MAPEDMARLAEHRSGRDSQVHWQLELLSTNRVVAAVDCMAVAVTIAGFVAVVADTRLAMHRCNFDPVVEYYCNK